MIAYRNAKGNYPRYKGDIQLVLPGWDFGDVLPEGWHEVVDVDPGEAPVHETINRQNFWYQLDPVFDVVTETWKQVWDYREGPSTMAVDDGQWWDMDIENGVWVLADVQPGDIELEPEPEA